MTILIEEARKSGGHRTKETPGIEARIFAYFCCAPLLRMPVTWFSIALGVIWVILDRKEPFRSHFWLTMLCAGASGVLVFVGFVLVGLIRRRGKRGESSESRRGL